MLRASVAVGDCIASIPDEAGESARLEPDDECALGDGNGDGGLSVLLACDALLSPCPHPVSDPSAATRLIGTTVTELLSIVWKQVRVWVGGGGACVWFFVWAWVQRCRPPPPHTSAHVLAISNLTVFVSTVVGFHRDKRLAPRPSQPTPAN